MQVCFTVLSIDLPRHVGVSRQPPCRRSLLNVSVFHARMLASSVVSNEASPPPRGEAVQYAMPFQDYPPLPAPPRPSPGHPRRQCNARSRSVQPASRFCQPRPLSEERIVAPWQPKRRVKAHTTTTQFSRDCNLEADRDGTGLGRPFLVRLGGMMMREKWGMAAQRVTPVKVASGSLHRRPFACCLPSHPR